VPGEIRTPGLLVRSLGEGPSSRPRSAAGRQSGRRRHVDQAIGRFWNGGIEGRLGDKRIGYLAEETMTYTAETIPLTLLTH